MNADGSASDPPHQQRGRRRQPRPLARRDEDRVLLIRDGNSEIYVMNADGTGPDPADQRHCPDAARVSPDGRRSPSLSSRRQFEIYAMNADGTGLTRLTNDSASDLGRPGRPTAKIAFTRPYGNNEIFR